MEKETLFVAICNQKGGIGKSTLTILAAAWLHYGLEKNVVVVDCDYPQHSIDELRAREIKKLLEKSHYQQMLKAQCDRLGKKAYTVLRARPENAIEQVRAFLDKTTEHVDVVLFDLPGTVNAAGVIYVLSSLDYVFVPMRADRLVMQSTINFAQTLRDRFVQNPAAQTRDIWLFWNMVDKRERPDLCGPFERLLTDLDLKFFKSRVLVRSKFIKEISDTGGPTYRTTLFLPEKRFLAESGFAGMMQEMAEALNV